MFGTPYKHKMLRLGQIVVPEWDMGGKYKIVDKFPGVPGWDCDRYTIVDCNTGGTHYGVRDKDLMTRKEAKKYFNSFSHGC